jgi:hypothetical protein
MKNPEQFIEDNLNRNWVKLQAPETGYGFEARINNKYGFYFVQLKRTVKGKMRIKKGSPIMSHDRLITWLEGLERGE